MSKAGRAHPGSDVAPKAEPSFRLGRITPLARLARFREAAYRLISQAFLYPDGEALTIAGEARDDEILDQLAFSAEWRRLQSALSELKPAHLTHLQNRYVALFMSAPGGVPCPPYESAHRAQPGQDSGWVLADIEREYAAAGLSRSSSLKEPPDHLSLEMEFMAVLCGQESRAWQLENLRQGTNLLKKQGRFLDRHLGAWLPRFAQALAAADGGSLYATVGTTAEAFVTHDRDLVRLLTETLSEQEAGVEGLPS